MPLLLAAWLGLAGAPFLDAQVLYVKVDASGAANGTSWRDAFPSLQTALAAAGAGSEIWVARGLYLPGAAGQRDASFALRSGVALYGGFAGVETARWQRDPETNPTALSGDLDQNDTFGSGASWYLTANGFGGNAYHVLTANGVDATAICDGFVIQQGWAVGTTGWQWAGAGLLVQNGSPTLRACRFTHCISYWYGGAVHVAGGRPLLQDCRFVETMVSDGKGGAIAAANGAQPTIVDCEFRHCTSRGAGGWGAGGGVFLDQGSPGMVRGCRFVGNVGTQLMPGGVSGCFGGGLFNFAHGTVVEACRFLGNTAHAGGGLFTIASLTVRDCEFDGNRVQAHPISGGSSGGYGGGLAAMSVLPGNAVPVERCTFVANTASDGGGGARFYDTTGAVTHCIFRGNSDSRGTVGVSQCAGQKPRWSCVQNLLLAPPGEPPPDPREYPGSFDLDPLFADADGANNVRGDDDDDLRLQPASPCIDAGDPARTAGGRDVGDVPRLIDGNLDLVARLDPGAHEFTPVRLTVGVTSAAGGVRVEFRVLASAAGTTVLVIGLPGTETPLPPFGALFLDLGVPPLVVATGPPPVTLVAGSVPAGVGLAAQAFLLAPTGAGALSNLAPFRL
ncbi:MAG: right-handed parallel beta-helix repeat-containing protein [Planctomycetes bacterium]|nr:right-handed parallel beta-helix repeat-containing protein [Planctomycetota bacterium]